MSARGNWPAGRRSLPARADGAQGRPRRRRQAPPDPELLALVKTVPVFKNGVRHTWSEAAGRYVPAADELPALEDDGSPF
jgi:hypothetical protein